MDCNRPRMVVWWSFVMSVIVDIVFICKLVSDIQNPENLLLLAAVILCGLITMVAGATSPVVSLFDEGVYVRRFFYTQKYEWEEIIQVGMLHRPMFFDWKNGEIVMLVSGGVKRRPGEFLPSLTMLFELRNTFCKFQFPDEPEAREIILKNYGPLDFDDVNHKIETL